MSQPSPLRIFDSAELQTLVAEAEADPGVWRSSQAVKAPRTVTLATHELAALLDALAAANEWQPMASYPRAPVWETGPKVLLLLPDGDVVVGYERMRTDDPEDGPPGFTMGEWSVEPVGWMHLPRANGRPSTPPLLDRALRLVAKLHEETVLSEGQCSKALDLDRVTWREICDRYRMEEEARG